jgi:hypothetical protein
MALGIKIAITAGVGALVPVFALILTWAVAVDQSEPSRDDIANSLPSTSLSTDGTDRSNLPRLVSGFANAQVAVNPQAPDARAVGEKTCIACHWLEADHFAHTQCESH